MWGILRTPYFRVVLYTRSDSSNRMSIIQSLLVNLTYRVAAEASVLAAQALKKKLIV